METAIAEIGIGTPSVEVTLVERTVFAPITILKPMTDFEQRIFEALVMKRGEIVTKAELEELLYRKPSQVFRSDVPVSNTIEVFMGRLRKKLAAQITTVRGRGYRLEK